MRGMLGFLILFLLLRKLMHGQEIADEVVKRGGDGLTPGTIYPALKSLKYAGFLNEKQKIGKTITYSLAPTGTKASMSPSADLPEPFLELSGKLESAWPK